MQSIGRKFSLLTVGAIIVGGVLLASFDRVEARPTYKSVFQKKYEKKLEKKQMTCLICHEKKDNGKPDTKKRNNYGKAVKKAIGKKNEKDKKKVGTGLDTAGKEKSAVKDKTFAELIEEGKVPASTE